MIFSTAFSSGVGAGGGLDVALFFFFGCSRDGMISICRVAFASMYIHTYERTYIHTCSLVCTDTQLQGCREIGNTGLEFHWDGNNDVLSSLLHRNGRMGAVMYLHTYSTTNEKYKCLRIGCVGCGKWNESCMMRGCVSGKPHTWPVYTRP